MWIRKQEDVNDCGLAVLQALIYYYHHQKIALSDLKLDAAYDQSGINVANLQTVAQRYGVLLNPFKGTYQSFLKLALKNPLIVILTIKQQSHYVIVTNKRKQITYYDPLSGRQVVSFAQFEALYQAVVITTQKSVFQIKATFTSPAFQIFWNYKKTFLSLSCAGMIILVLAFSSSYFIKILFDQILPYYLNNLLLSLFLAFGWVSLSRLCLQLLQSHLTKKMSFTITIDLYHLVYQQIRKANWKDVAKLTKMDQMKRFALIELVTKFYTERLGMILVEAFALLAALTCLLLINLQLIIIFLMSGIVTIAATLSVRMIAKKYLPKQLASELKLMRTLFDFISSWSENKNVDYSLNQNIHFQKDLESYKTRQWKLWKIHQFKFFSDHLIQSLVPLATMFFGAKLVFMQQISSGDLLFDLALFNYFMTPLLFFSNLLADWPQVQKYTQLIDYILKLKNERLLHQGVKIDFIRSISFRNYTFAYMPLQPVFKIKALEIKTNALVRGGNGSGKSTFLNVLAARIRGQGVLLINGIALENINLQHYRQKVFLATMQSYIPACSLLNYLGDGKAEYTKLFLANFQRFELQKLLAAAQLSLNIVLFENASNLSTGQRQFVILLKLFTRQYHLVLLDEVAENLDYDLKMSLLHKIRTYQKNALIVVTSHQAIENAHNQVINFAAYH